MSNQDFVGEDTSVSADGNKSVGREGDFADAIDKSVKNRVLEIDKWGVGASDSRNFSSNARNVFDNGFFGFVGHDGLPWVLGRSSIMLVAGHEVELSGLRVYNATV